MLRQAGRVRVHVFGTRFAIFVSCALCVPLLLGSGCPLPTNPPVDPDPNSPTGPVNVVTDSTVTPSVDGTLSAGGSGRQLTVGEAIAGPGSGGRGFLRRVTAVQTNSAGNAVSYRTEEVALADVVAPNTQVRIHQEVQLGKTQTAKMYQRAQMSSCGLGIDVGDATLYEQDGLRIRIVDGCLGFDPAVDLDVDFGLFGIERATFSVGGELAGRLLVEISADAPVNLRENVNLNDLLFGGQPFRATFNAGYVFGTVEVSLFAGFDFDSQVQGTLTAGGEATASLTLGADYLRGRGWSPTSTADHSFTIIEPVVDSSGGSATIRVYIYPRVEVWLYGAVGPWAEAEPSVDLTGALNTCTFDWSAGAALDARVGGTLRVLQFTLADIGPFHLIDRADTHVVLASGQIPLDSRDSDGDGVLDCEDGCPNDPNKTSPGNCGCGEPETPDCAGQQADYFQDERARGNIRYYSPDGDHFTDHRPYFRVDYLDIPASVAPGQTVNGSVGWSVIDDGLNRNAVVYKTLLAEWSPNNPIALIQDGELDGSARSINHDFSFTAPTAPGVYRIRMAATWAFEGIQNFYGDGPKGDAWDPGVGDYSEVTIEVRN